MIEEMVRTAVAALDSKKGFNLKVLKVEGLTSLADWFVLCNGSSNTQVGALADECEFKMKEAGYTLLHREGREEGTWVLLDYGDVIVHVFTRETRDFYKLDHFWKDGVEIDVKELLGE